MKNEFDDTLVELLTSLAGVEDVVFTRYSDWSSTDYFLEDTSAEMELDHHLHVTTLI